MLYKIQPSLYQSSFNHRNRTSKKYLLRDLLQGIDLYHCGAGARQVQISKAGHEEEQAGILGHSKAAVR